ncbi:helix-turn-helix domain-containing protein [Streptomyces sp. PSKA54]|uniref:Helix-turn-helix domain-containing protein n=1 Tax=Streptomyces himalayensis subsp. aureolus TaxID=2758039 RepID=A0A7W2D1S4_9ACTN|nr:helix-turn-helix domain-containing protein [Streptomyces himalayensis]MBA4863106.1 helix-turn-helix domain-containing protein [Streptomyces himalayensis subsp. aureolus]
MGTTAAAWSGPAREGPGTDAEPAVLERELTEAVLAGAARSEVLRALRGATGRDVRLLSAEGVPLATTDGGAGVPASVADGVLADVAGPVVDTLDGLRATALPVRAGTTVAGVLLTVGPGDARVQALAGAAVTALLIDAVRAGDDSAEVSPQHTPADIVAALRSGTVSPSVCAAAAGLRIDLQRPPAGAVLHYSGPRLRAWSTALAWLEHPVQQEARTAWTVVPGEVELARLQNRLRLMTGDESADHVVAASGSHPGSPMGLARSFTEAERLLGLARTQRVPLLTFDRCGVVQVLLPLPRPRLEAYAEARLGPIRQRPELMATLRAWLAERGSRQSVSEQLHLHRNSVGYRVRQIKNLLGTDPLLPAASAELHLALAALDLLASDDERLRDDAEPVSAGR